MKVYVDSRETKKRKEKAKKYFDVMDLKGNKAIKDFSRITFLEPRRIIKQ